MDNIFPFIMQTLSSKPQSVETEKNLLKDLRQKLRDENIKSRNLKKDFEQALEIGQDLGLFRLIGEKISLPFLMQNKKQLPDAELTRSKSVSDDDETIPEKNKLTTTDKEQSHRRRRRSTSRRRQGRSRSRSGSHARSQRRRRGSRK